MQSCVENKFSQRDKWKYLLFYVELEVENNNINVVNWKKK